MRQTRGMRRDDRSKERAQLFTTIAFFALVSARAAIGCDTSSPLYQGEAYEPDGAIAIGPATERTDASACDGECADAMGDVATIPLVDGSTEPSNTCATARTIGTVSGDTGATSTTATGTCSEWLSVRVTEDDSSALGAPMHVTLTLTPTDSDFDFYAYFDPNTDGLECATPPFKSSFNPGDAVETIALDWGEGTVANSSDDSRTIAIAIIKAPDAPCSDKTIWNLVVSH